MTNHPKLAVTADIVIFSINRNDLQVLLVRRKYPPYQGRWAIPGGFVREDESLEEAAIRELKEETGVEHVYLEQLFTFGNPGRDPRGRVVTVAYFALINKDQALTASTDAEATAWYSMNQLPSLAFDHEQIVQYALQRLRWKLEYTTVGFQLLPSKFTLTELQHVYEVILGRELDKRNFRKKIATLDLIVPLKEKKMEGVHRPAQLYSFKSSQFLVPKGVI